MKKQITLSIYIQLIIIFVLTGCKKFVEVEPPFNQIVSEVVFENDQMAFATANGMYSEMSKSNFGFVSGSDISITTLTSLSADELKTSVSAQMVFANNTLTATNEIVKSGLWDNTYKIIYYANSILAGLSRSSVVTDSVAKELEGEAKFMRAFCHFYLTNLFGEVPVVTTIDYRINNTLQRSSVMQVYEQIVTDLEAAQTLLREDYKFSNGERTKPNAWAARALLSRVYLYRGEWDKAEASSTMLINNPDFDLTSSLYDVFLANGKEAIWQLAPVQPLQNTNEAQVFVPFNIPATEPSYWLTDELLSTFETDDGRKTAWIGSVDATNTGQTFPYPFKYKVYQTNEPVTEYYCLLRLAEQYLIRAEARIKQGKLTGASAAEIDLNKIRVRAGLLELSSLTQSQMEDAIVEERRHEFFAELGHRWFDLKRWHQADAILSTLKAPNWQSTDTLYPIPQADRINNSNLTQNQGY